MNFYYNFRLRLDTIIKVQVSNPNLLPLASVTLPLLFGIDLIG